MKYIILTLKASVIIFLIILFSCDKDSTEPVPLSSFISVSGDISESYDVFAFFGISTYSSGTYEKEYFTITLLPKTPGTNELAMTLLYNSGPESPEVDIYNIAEHAFGEDIPESEFGGSFSGRNVTDLSAYFMTTGMLIITESSASKISGEVEMSGYYVKLLEQDSTRIVTISGKFNATPMQD